MVAAVTKSGKRVVLCCVPFCQRTRGDRKNDPLPNDGTAYEWICGEHWKRVDRRIKRVLNRCKKTGQERLARHCWDKYAKPQAIERAMGIG